MQLEDEVNILAEIAVVAEEKILAVIKVVEEAHWHSCEDDGVGEGRDDNVYHERSCGPLVVRNENKIRGEEWRIRKTKLKEHLELK